MLLRPVGPAGVQVFISLSLCRRGALLRRLKDFGAALKDLAKARQLCADEGPEAQEARRQLVLTYNDRAVHCYTRGRLNEAVMLLGEALRDERTEEGLYVNRGGKWGSKQGPQGKNGGSGIGLGCQRAAACTYTVHAGKGPALGSCVRDWWLKVVVGLLGSLLILIPVPRQELCAPRDAFPVSAVRR